MQRRQHGEARRNAFLAQPPRSFHHGVATFPGFHTATSIEAAATYAISACDQKALRFDDDLAYVNDYPVVVALDMNGLRPLVDYDAVHYVGEVLNAFLQHSVLVYQLAEENVEGMDDEAIADAVSDAAEGATDDDPRERPNDGLDLIGNAYLDHRNAFYRLRDLSSSEVAAAVRAVAAGEPIPDDVLIACTGQFRYEQDVDADRLLSVWYVRPVARDLAPWSDDDSDDVDKRWPGFTVLGEDDDLSPPLDIDEVWQAADMPVVQSPQYALPLGPEARTPPRVEYHGTLLSLLRRAAPWLRLPAPPTPPYVKGL